MEIGEQVRAAGHKMNRRVCVCVCVCVWGPCPILELEEKLSGVLALSNTLRRIQFTNPEMP